MEKSQLQSSIKILLTQLKQEAREYQMDCYRMSESLDSVGISPVATGGDQGRYLKSLEITSTVLDALAPDEVNLTMGVSDLKEELEEIKDKLGSSQKRIGRYQEELPNILKQKVWWLKELAAMDAKEEHNQLESNKTIKSTLFHSKKKTQYETEMKLSKQGLISVGYEESLSHKTLVRLGSEVQKMEERLKPLRLELNSYEDLPPGIAQARVKLEEKRDCLIKIEKEFAEKLVDIGANAPSVS